MRPHRWVETRARIAWKNESKTVAGLQFLNATPDLLAEVGQWLSFGASLKELRGDWWPQENVPEGAPAVQPSALVETEILPAVSPEMVEVPAQASGHQMLAEKKEKRSPLPLPVKLTPSSVVATPTPHAASHKGVVAIAGICILVVLAFLGWREGLGKRGNVADSGKQAASGPEPAEVVPATIGLGVTPTQLPDSAPKPVKASESAASDVPKTVAVPLPAGDSGFVLQVAAMSEVENANNLAQALQEKQLPAFVSKKDTDRFYRVLVGPYSDQSDLRQAQATLGAQGYASIEKNWSR